MGQLFLSLLLWGREDVFSLLVAVGQQGRMFLTPFFFPPLASTVYPSAASPSGLLVFLCVFVFFFFRSTGSGNLDHPTEFVLVVPFPSHLLGVGPESTF